jgi:hypothetical protein
MPGQTGAVALRPDTGGTRCAIRLDVPLHRFAAIDA